jgi:hypothetical protein
VRTAMSSVISDFPVVTFDSSRFLALYHVLLQPQQSLSSFSR